MTSPATQPAAAEPSAPAPPPPSTPIVLEAIVKRLAIAATYNRVEVTLSPHILYTRHGELYLDALTIDRDGAPPKEVKLGTFKLAGLGAVRLTPRRFERSDLFGPGNAKYAGVTLLAIEG